MSFKFSAAHSSRIKKSKPGLKRSSSTASPFSSLPRRKPVQRSASKPEPQHGEDDDEDFLGDRLDDLGLVKALTTDLTLRDVPQALQYIKTRMFERIPERAAGMNSTRISEVLNFRLTLPPLVTVSHIQALLSSPTTAEREIAEMNRAGVLRKITVPGRGGIGEVLVLVQDLEVLIRRSSLQVEVKEAFVKLLRDCPTAQKIARPQIQADHAKALMHAGFLTASSDNWTTTDVFSRPGDGLRGTMTSLGSISKAASGSLAAVGGEGAVLAGGGGGGARCLPGSGDLAISLPATGSLLKLLAAARAHLLALLGKSKFREAPETLLRQRWDGGIAQDDAASAARKNRGEFTGVLAGRTRKWKQFYGISFEWILGECVGAGLVEVFDTGSIGRGVRAI
ncbi:hypothetical protein PVAG01_05604 [Phlyctema vagabunda]|uniref:Serine-threonine protein kinase 19 n=1 Tax=Phlyctema vagabunda TaxID=108571 RepID=A0ABR4PKJ1_9HELO